MDNQTNPENAQTPKTPQKVAILTSGGLAPCLSSAVGYLIEAYTRVAPSVPIICYLNGYRGLLLGDKIEVTPTIREQAPKLQHLGGSPIGNSRVRLKNAEDCAKRGLVQPGESPEKVAALQLIRDGATILHTIGGDDTNLSAGDLSLYLREHFDDYRLAVVGLPKTIDNDVRPVSQTLGAQTAAEQGALFFRNVVAEYSSNPKMLIVHEIMGRNSGWLAAKTAQVYTARNRHSFPLLVARERTAVHAVYVPEATFELAAEADRLRAVLDGVGCVNVFLSEGSCSEVILAEMARRGEEVKRDAFGHVRLDTLNPGKWFSEEMAKLIGAEKVLVQKSGYFCRAAPANDFDRRLVRACVEKSVEYALKGLTGLAGPDEEQNDEIHCIPYSRVSGGKPFDLATPWFVRLMADIGQPVLPLHHAQNPPFFSYRPKDRAELNIDYGGRQSSAHLVSLSTVALLPVSSDEADAVARLPQGRFGFGGAAGDAATNADAAAQKRAAAVVETVCALMATCKNVAAALADVECSDGSASFKALANSLFERSLAHVAAVSAVASLDKDVPLMLNEKTRKGGLNVILDPADGSSNIDINVSVGTIFGIYAGEEGEKPDFVRKGDKLIASGYCLYGSATIMVLTLGDGVHGFTLDAETNQFVLSHPNVVIPRTGTVYSVNEGYFNQWKPKMQNYVNSFKIAKMSLRYIGTFVADFHRILFHGGVFLYPSNSQHKNGKLRLLSEVNPLSLLAEQAGGRAVLPEGRVGQRVLELEPAALDQCVPVALGSAGLIDDLVARLGA